MFVFGCGKGREGRKSEFLEWNFKMQIAFSLMDLNDDLSTSTTNKQTEIKKTLKENSIPDTNYMMFFNHF